MHPRVPHRRRRHRARGWNTIGRGRVPTAAVHASLARDRFHIWRADDHLPRGHGSRGRDHVALGPGGISLATNRGRRARARSSWTRGGVALVLARVSLAIAGALLGGADVFLSIADVFLSIAGVVLAIAGVVLAIADIVLGGADGPSTRSSGTSPSPMFPSLATTPDRGAQPLARSSPLVAMGPATVGRGAGAPASSTAPSPAPAQRPAAARRTQWEDRMDAKSRRKLEMGTRALEFSRGHPDTSPGYTAALTRLEERLTRADQLASRQRAGQLEVRAATARKAELRRAMQQAHLAHLAQVGKAAAREIPELAQKFVFRPGTTTYLAFRTAARGMAAEAQNQKEALVKHGLVETVLDNLVQVLDQFDAAVEHGAEGRQAHVGASAELHAVADEVVQVVRVMDGLNRYRFMNDAELLAAWESASSVAATPRAGTSAGTGPEAGPPAGGEIRPAA